MDVSAWLDKYREQFAPYEVPGEEREQLLTEGEVGTYPGDETLMPRIERSGRKEFEQLKSQRLDLTGQVKQARQREKELHPYPKIERFADKVLGYVPGILSPDVKPEQPQQESPSARRAPITTPPTVKPSRFTVEEGEIIDTKNRQVLAPHEFNRLSNQQEKDEIAAQLKAGGYLIDEPPGEQPAPLTKALPPFKDKTQEAKFQQWYKQNWASRGLNPNPDDPQHFYDYRRAFQDGMPLTPDPTDLDEQGRPRLHGDSKYKLPGHPREFVDTPQGRLNTITGQVDQAAPPIPGVLRDVQARNMGSAMDGRFGVQDIAAPKTDPIKRTIDQGAASLAKKQKELTALRDQLDGILPKLQIRTGEQADPTPEQVEQYNTTLGIFNQKVQEYNAAREQHNQVVGQYNGTIQQFGRQQVTPQIRPHLDPFTPTPGLVTHLNEPAKLAGPPPPAPARSLSEAITMATNNFFKGVAGIPADAMKAIAIAQQELAKTDMKSSPIPLEERTAYKLGKTIEDIAKRTFPSDPASQQDFLIGTLPQAAGSMVGFLGGSLLGTVAKIPAAITAAGLGAAVGGTQQYEDAAHFTEDPAIRGKAFVLGSVVGTTEALPIAGILNRYNKATGGTFFRVLKEAGITAAQEFLQEGAQQTLGNEIAIQLYDESRPLFENAGISASAGGITGAVTGFVSGLLQGRKIRKQMRLQEGSSGTSPFAGEPTPPPQPQPMPATPDMVATIPDSLNIRQQAPFLVKKFPSPSRPAPELVPGLQQAPVQSSPAPAPAPLPQLPVPAMEQPPIVPPTPDAASPEPLPGAVLSEPEPIPQEAMVPPVPMQHEAERLAYSNEDPAPVTDETATEEVAPEAPPPTPDNLPDVQAQEAATSPTNELPEPTEAQKKAGNYKKGPVRIAGLDISIENPQGSTRSGTDSNGKPWTQEMRDHYGYIKGTVGKDKDHVDVFVKPGTPEDYDGTVYVIDQKNPDTGRFDESKVILGASSPQEAKDLYHQNYAKDWKGYDGMQAFGMDAFKRWVKNPEATQSPAKSYNEVNPKQEQEQAPPTPDQVAQPVQPKPPKAKVTKAKDEKPIAAVPFMEPSPKQDAQGKTEFTYPDQLGKRPTVKMIIGDWRKAGRPKSFTATYGETEAKFHFEELHGIPQWWDEGNGAKGIDRNMVLDALKAEKFHEEQTETPPTPESVSTAPQPTRMAKKAHDTSTPESVSTESPSQQQPAPTPEQVTEPKRDAIKPKEEAKPSPTPEEVAKPVEKEKPKEAPIAVPMPNGQDVIDNVRSRQLKFKHAKTIEEKEQAIREAHKIVNDYVDAVASKMSPERLEGYRKRFNEITSGMEQAIADLKKAPAPPTPEAVAPKEKPVTIKPPTPEEVSNEQPQRARTEDTASPGTTPAEVVPITAGQRKAETVRPPAAERRGGATEQPGGERTQTGRSDGADTKPDLPSERGRPAEPERDDAAVSGPAGTDYSLPEDLDIPKGQKAKFKANVEAIQLLKRLETEGRLATPAEQAVLARYTGWGGLPQAFQWSYEWQKELSQLRELLTEEEYNSARASTPNAHYTDPSTIRAIYTGLEHLGFKGGRLLEPGAGVGHFLGAMPEGMAGKSQRTAVELDSLSARIAKQLYQRANVINSEYQKVALPQDFFDVAVGNVPFANVKVFDPNNKDLNKLNFSLHDYYFAKAISQVRPGGIVAFITSRYTMDKVNGKLRDYLSKHADLLGAIRLPNTQFKDIANTDVTTDIIVLQKRDPGTPYGGHAWGTLKDVQTEQGPASVNEYFAAHPEQIMGKLALTGSQYRDKEITVETDNRDMPQALREAFARLPEKVLRPRAKPTSSTPRGLLEALQATDDVKNGAFTIQNNALYVRDREQFVPVEGATPTDLERAKGLIGLREQVREVFRTQLASAEEKDIAQARKELNTRYDKFVKKWGPINGRANKSLFRADPDYATLQALEKDYDKKANTAKKADIFSKRVIEYRQRVATAGSPKEALLVSLNEAGAIDWDRMAELTGQTTKELQEGLRGVVYQDPSGTWDTADGYLSGNVRQKLKAAEEAAKIDPRYKENVEALKQVIPEDLKPEQIHMKLGHGWVPTDVYHDFIAHLLGISTYNKNLAVKYNAQVGAYSVTLPKQLDKTRNETTYGTPRYEAKDLIQDGLHSQLPTVWDKTFDDKRVVNEKETLAAREKLEAIQDEFRKWVWQDPERTKTLSRLYNDEFNSMVERKLDGAHLTLPGANPLIQLRPHQKNVIWRALQSGNTLLAHVVGAGKTFAMVGIAMESRRLRLANKPMIAVPNHLVEQWRDSVLALYPAAKVLMATKEDFEAANRKQLVARIATGDWDLVVISHSQLSRIPISLESFENFVTEQTEILEEYIREMKAESGKQSRNITKELEKAKKRLEAKLERRKAEVEERADNAVNFEETGVDMLLVDEADLFKNLYFPTRMTRVAGLPNTESQRSYDLFLKTQYLNKLTKNKGVIFATGTPVSNSMAEVFTMQRYLQPQELEKAGLTHFDAWARQFGNTITSMELAPDGSGYRPRTRFAEFVNVPELTQMFRQVMDVQSQDDLKLPVPKLRTGKPINMVAKPSEELKAYTKDLIKRAENLKKMKVDPRKDNMLKITGDGRNAALDIRLRVPNAPEDKNGKVAMLINQVVEEHEKSKDVKGTQLVFLDLSTPKGEAKQKDGEPVQADEAELGEEAALRGSVYQDIKRKLIKRGIPEKEVAFIHDADTDEKKSKLFADVNAGRVRVLIGSTEKMGAGTNVQERMVAIHNLDAPWRPRDLEQRNGRGIRQGNQLYKENPDTFEFAVFNYATEAPSFDVYMWQTLEAKAKTIAQVMRGDPTIRTIQDVDTAVLSISEMKAIASGNPLIKERMTADVELRKLHLLKSQYRDNRERLRYELANLPSAEKTEQTKLEALRRDKAVRDASKPEPLSITIDGVTYDEAEDAGKAILQFVAEANATKRTETAKYPLGTYRGFNLGLSVFLDRDARLELARPSSLSPIKTTLFTSDASPAGIVDRLNNALNKVDTLIEEAELGLQKAKQREDELKAEIEKPFDKEERLKQLESRIADIDKQLDLTNKDEGVIGGGTEQAEPTPVEEPKPGILDKLMEERGSFQPIPGGKTLTEAESYRQQRIKEETGGPIEPTSPKEPAATKIYDGFDMPSETTMGLIRRRIQDKFIRVRDAQQAIKEAGGIVPEKTDTYLAEELYHGRVETKLSTFEREHVTPMIQAIKRHKLKVSEVEEYLYARHAPERNAKIASINARFADPDNPGSGMTDTEAEEILSGFEQAGKTAALEEVAGYLDDMNESRLKLIEEAGLESPETLQAWREAYQHYVPLKNLGEDVTPRTGKGFDIRGKESKRALGRRSLAKGLLAHTVAQAEETIVRAEKNRVGQRFLNLVRRYPNKRLWQINQVVKEQYFDQKTGEVHVRTSRTHKLADNVLSVKQDGKPYLVTIYDEGLASAMKNLGAERTGMVVRALASVNRYLAIVNTSMNPEFVLSNLARDMQTAGIHLAGEQSAAMSAKVLASIPMAMKGIAKHMMGKDGGEWGQTYRDFREAGGHMGFFGLRNADAIQQDILAKVSSAEGSIGSKALGLIRGTRDLIFSVNEAVENAVRLSAFKYAQDYGMTTEKAASLAKNLTVNFNRKGELGPIANALWLFYNAGTQGSVRMIQALKNPKVAGIAMSIAMASLALSMLNRATGGEDDDGLDKYDKIPQGIKERNLIVMRPDGSYFKLPLPYGYNIFHVLGAQIEAVANGGQSPMEGATAFLSAALNAFNPLGGEKTLAQMISPTITDPVVELSMNRDWIGRPIKPEQSRYAVKKPESQLYWNRTSPLSKDIAQTLNEITGGTTIRPGAIDVSPEVLDYLVGELTGGSGAFLNRTINAAIDLSKGKDIPTRRVPFVRVFAGDQPEYRASEDFMKFGEEVKRTMQEYEALSSPHASRVPGEQTATDFKKDRAVMLSLKEPLREAEREISKLYSQRRAIMESSLSADDKEAKAELLTEKINARKKEFNRLYRLHTKEQTSAGSFTREEQLMRRRLQRRERMADYGTPDSLPY